MVRLILALLALLIPLTAQAAGNQPPDVAAYVPITPTYAAGVTANTIGDGSTYGGTAPGDDDVANIATANRTSYFNTDTYGNTVGEFCVTDPVICPERKFRSHANVTHILYDDPIRNYGQPGTSHCHEFFGNGSVNAYSTYARIRRQADQYSRAGGGGINGTGYWFPCVRVDNPFADGKNYVVKPDVVIVYYAADRLETKLHTPPPGLRWVGGFNMDTGDQGAFMTAAVAAANAQSGTAGRYSLSNGGNISGGHRWVCNGVESKWLKNADNSDPFGGVCTTGQQLFIRFNGPDCWDGTNLWSPKGYEHVIPRVFDNVTATWVCPNGWFVIPHLTLEVLFTQTGFSDYGRWYLSSDAAGTTAAGRTILPGESFHTDWMMGWDGQTWDTIATNCWGINGNTAHQCANSIISSTNSLIIGQANPLTGRVPQVDLVTTYGTSTAAKMFRLPSSGTGDVVINMHGS